MTDFAPRKRGLIYGLLLLILLAAAAVRFHQLGAQSLWYDEGVAYGHSQRTLAQLIPALQNNVHVPAYFGTLALWEDFTGSSEYALRAYSALWSIIGVAATYALGRRLFSPVAGIAAAAFVALNTFNIYYAQEARMYAMLGTVSALSMWVFVGFVQRAQQWQPSPQQNRNLLYWALAFGLLNTIGAYTHYSYALVMLSQGIMALLWLVALWRSSASLVVTGRAFVLYSIANLLTIGLFAPWLVTAISQVSAQPNLSAALSLEQLLRVIHGWLAFGITFEQSMGGMAAVSIFLMIFGLLIHRHAQPHAEAQTATHMHAWWNLLLPVVWVGLSVAVYTYLELYTRYLRFLLPAQIGLALWLGRGVWVLWGFRTKDRNRLRYVPQAAAVVAGLAVTVALARGLVPLYTDDAYQRDDYRALAQTIAAQSHPDDAVILSAPGLREIFGYYYDGSAPVYPLPAGDAIAADTRAVINEHRRIYAVLYGETEQDPDSIVARTLNQNAYPLDSRWLDDIRLLRYVSPAADAANGADDMTTQTVDVSFGAAIVLEEYALNGETFAPDDILRLRLTWSAEMPVSERYKVFVQLLDASGALVAQRDTEPANGYAPTTTWQAGAVVHDQHALSVPAQAGTYSLIVGLYAANDPSTRLPVQDATYYPLADITVRE